MNNLYGPRLETLINLEDRFQKKKQIWKMMNNLDGPRLET